MSPLELLLIAAGLAADCFAVALGASISRRRLEYARMFRTAGAFGLAQFVMPVAGWFLGRTVVDFVSGFDHWVVFALLAGVGGHMMWEALRDDDGRHEADITRGFLLFTMAVATSIDSLAVGLSFALLGEGIMIAGAVIGAVAFSITSGGFVLGCRAGRLLGERARLAGGLVLIVIGARMLVSHLVS